MMPRYLALLRGVNVGGSNIIRMTALRACFERHGFTGVATYIQSGNVLFTTDERRPAALTTRLEAMLAAAFDYRASVVLRSLPQMRGIVSRAPAGFGTQPALYRYDVLFLKPRLTTAAVLGSVRTRDGVDQAHPGPGVVYFSRLIARASQSRLARVAAMPIYQDMTIRNWNTTTRLLAMLEGT